MNSLFHIRFVVYFTSNTVVSSLPSVFQSADVGGSSSRRQSGTTQSASMLYVCCFFFFCFVTPNHIMRAAGPDAALKHFDRN